MIDIATIRIPIVNGLQEHTGATTILAEQSAHQPPYPFIGIKFTLIGLPIGQVTEYQVGRSTVIEQDLELVLSVTSTSEEIESATNLAYKALEWFNGKGWLSLADLNIQVVKVENMTNRDVFLNVEYERRQGFDVRLRVRGQASYLPGTIEEINLQEG